MASQLWYRGIRVEVQNSDIISLFCGAGGLDIGFATAGFTTRVAFDKFDAAVQTMCRNHGDNVGVNADLGTVQIESLIAAIDLRAKGAAPLGVVAGPPCQGFSRSNVTRSDNDVRNDLLDRCVNIIAALRRQYGLAFCVIENVPELLKPRHAERLDRVRATLENAGFQISTLSLEAANYGVPQVRARMMIVGIAKEFNALPLQVSFPPTAIRSVRNAIEHLPEPAFKERGARQQEIPFHKNHWTMRPLSTKFKTGDFNRGRSFRRLAWDLPSPTVAYGNREIHVHPNGTRRLSLFEAMLLQGFPPDYVLCGTLSDQVTQVSNAVPPPMAAAVATMIRGVLDRGSSNSDSSEAVSVAS